MIQDSKLYLYTFASIFASMLAVGFVVVPIVINYIQTAYIELQIDVNRRQVESVAQVLSYQLQMGADPEDVREKLQVAIQGTETERGFLCMINRNDTRLLCHPNPEMVGAPVDQMNFTFDDVSSQKYTAWAHILKKGDPSGGILNRGEGKSNHINFVAPVPGTDWMLSSHENAERMQSELSYLRAILTIGAIVLGLILAIPASWAARRVSSRYEHKIEDKNQMLQKQNQELEEERQKSEWLLLNILPSSIANRLKQNEKNIVDSFENITVLFSDIVGFTEYSVRVNPELLIKNLNEIFSTFDALADKYQVEKIKTIGDAYMVAGGLPEPDVNHAQSVAEMGLEMLKIVKNYSLDNDEIKLRIGVHSGSAIAGVIGTSKFIYDLWGDTVNTASRMESHGIAGKIHVSEDTYLLLKDRFIFEERGEIEVKGKGRMRTYFLIDHK